MNRLRLLLVVLLLAPLRTMAQGQEGSVIFVVIDTSGSMRGKCGSTCKPCQRDMECPDAHQCAGGRCRMNRDLESRACVDRWDTVVSQAERYLDSLPDGTTLRIFTFDSAGARPVPLTPAQILDGTSRSTVRSKLRELQPTSRCTRIYDIVGEVHRQLVAMSPGPNRDRTLHVLSDGDDDGSRSTGDQLRAQLQSVEGISWQFVAPRGALKDLCGGDDQHCRSLDQDASQQWELEPTLIWESPSPGLSLKTDTVNAVVRLRVVGERPPLFPFAVSVQFEPGSDQVRKLLRFQGPKSLRFDRLEVPLTFTLIPDLTTLRPDKLSGTLRLAPRQGSVNFLGPSEFPIDISVASATFQNPPVSARRYDTPEQGGTALEYPIPHDVYALLTHVPGYRNVKWDFRLSISRDAQIPKPIATIRRGDLEEGSRLLFSLSGRCPEEERRRGTVSVSPADSNTWFSLGSLVVPIDLAPCDGSSSSGFGWILLGILVLGAIGALVVTRLRHPDIRFVGLLAQSTLGTRDLGAPLRNNPWRLGNPQRSMPLNCLGSADEVDRFVCDHGGDKTSVATFRLLPDGTIMLETALAVLESLAREGPDRDRRLTQLPVGRVSARGLSQNVVFRVLNDGPLLRLCDLRDNHNDSLFDGVAR